MYVYMQLFLKPFKATHRYTHTRTNSPCAANFPYKTKKLGRSRNKIYICIVWENSWGLYLHVCFIFIAIFYPDCHKRRKLRFSVSYLSASVCFVFNLNSKSFTKSVILLIPKYLHSIYICISFLFLHYFSFYIFVCFFPVFFFLSFFNLFPNLFPLAVLFAVPLDISTTIICICICLSAFQFFTFLWARSHSIFQYFICLGMSAPVAVCACISNCDGIFSFVCACNVYTF